MTEVPTNLHVRRSDATRAAILDAARERFATDGYERATIRAIAGDAGIDPAMVMRYFGSKEKLFAAAAEFDLRLPEVGDTGIGATLVGHFLQRWEEDDALNLLLRAAATTPAAAARMQSIFATQVAPKVAKLCPDPEQTNARATLAASQILGMALVRYVLKIPPAARMSREEIIRWLAPTVERYLLSPTPDPPPDQP